jgi:hypothetical protein
MKARSCLVTLLAATCLLISGCLYDFPLTAKATRKVDPALLGDWVSFDKDEQKMERMSVRRLDESTYVVALEGDIYRAFHSDFAGVTLLSVQNLQSGSDEGKYIYYRYDLSADHEHLGLRAVSEKVVTEATKSADEAQRLIKANLTNPKLYGDELQFTRKKSR